MESVEYGNSIIEFQVKRTSRRTLGISVLPCGSIEVTAPEYAPLCKIKEVVLKRGTWLLEQKRLTGFNPVLQPQKQFISGESFYLLGRHYRLKVFEANYDSVDILDDRLILNCTFPEDFELKRSLILKWYMTKANNVLTARFSQLASNFDQEGIQLAVKRLSKRWGEYHPNKKLIALNAELVVAPMECIDYVIIHELCHVTCLNHGPEFHDLLTARLPHWRDLKNELERHSLGLSLL